MSDQTQTAATSRVTSTFSGVGGVNSITRSDTSKARAVAWPAAVFLAVVPTANIQTPGYFFSLNETCVYSYRRKEYGLGDYEVYASWYVPRWEEIKVPQMKKVSHIQANLKFTGDLKWLPYEP